MANTSVNQWDTNPNNNTDINGTNLAEGCSPGGINDAIREMMAQIAADVALVGAPATISGAWNYTGDATFDSDVKAIYGTAGGSQLSIWHSQTSTGFVTADQGLVVRAEGGNATLSLQGNVIEIGNEASSAEKMAIFNSDGSVDLYYDNSKKFETDAAGVIVAGGLTATGIVEGVGVKCGLTWQNMIGARAANTVYQNTTGYDIEVSIAAATSVGRSFSVSQDGVTFIPVGRLTSTGLVQQIGPFVVPDGHAYMIDGNVDSITIWAEFR